MNLEVNQRDEISYFDGKCSLNYEWFKSLSGKFQMKRKAQNNTVFARLWRSKYQALYGTAFFLLIYLLLLYAGSKGFLFAGTLCEGGKRWPSFLIVGLIILASSLLSKMFQDWLREKGNEGLTDWKRFIHWNR